MAGHVRGVFHEKLSPYLRRQHETALESPVENAELLNVIGLQYFADAREHSPVAGERRRHYEAQLAPIHRGATVRGLERLYRRTVVLMPTLVCAAHCRWCLRGQYDITHMSMDDIDMAARYCGEAPEAAGIDEVLVTGGDPLMDVARLERVLTSFAEFAPRITWMRIGTRVPLQEPSRIDDAMLDLFRTHRHRIELGLHVNHALELLPDVRRALDRITDTGVRVYNQSVLLRGLNDSVPALENLVESLRDYGIEMHYLFHCVPIRGMAHHRTTVDLGLDLVRRLTASGRISGRAKPDFVLMTDVGKVTPYEGTILERRGDRLLLQTAFSHAERLEVNPAWALPDTASVDDEGLLRVWYQDAPAR
jgi:lysine 2,3-aminomutase